MKRTDTQIHHIELLLTLDYLLNHTDKKHPASQQDICRHALNFGLQYDPKAKCGNDVRRQRIGECLQFLQSLCYKYGKDDKIPFMINTTNGGKFYLEKKNTLNDEQIIKVLSAIKNDKYTKDEDTDFLIEKLLDVFSNGYTRDYFKKELQKATKNVTKYDHSANRKMRLVYKAYDEGKMIKLRYNTINKFRKPCDAWYRVYKIKEFENKPYALLLLVGNEKEFHVYGLLFDAIENLSIPNIDDTECLCEDMDENRDLNQLFATKCKGLHSRYGDIDNFLKANIRPDGLLAYRVSFYFSLRDEEVIRRSFEEFFSAPLEYTKCSSFGILKVNGVATEIYFPKKDGEGTLKPNPSRNHENLRYGVCNILLNRMAFMEWILTNLDIDRNIGDLITIVSPSFFNENMAEFYYEHFSKYKDYLNKKEKENRLSEMKSVKKTESL